MILVTGATGFLGAHLIAELLKTEMPILALVRAAPGQAEARLMRAWWDHPKLAALIGSRIRVFSGDVTHPDLGLALHALAFARESTHIVHAAADIRLAAPLDALRRVNRDGTARVVEFAASLPGLSRMAYVSTAYVAGACPGPVAEEHLSCAYGFRSPYELSKFEGERLVRDAMPSLPVTVTRPGMVVGHSDTGAVRTFNTLYLPLRLYLSGKLPVIPARPSLPLPMVPVDYVARSVVSLLLDPLAEGATVHLVPPHEECPAASEVLDAAREWARDHLGLRLGRPLFVPLPLPRRLKTWRASDPPAGRMKALLPYVEGPVFRRDTADRLLGPYDLDWRTMMPALLSRAVACGFMHRSERTVHEQVAFRLGRPSRPIRYHDIVEARVVTFPASRMAESIQAARRSLHALGIRKGDRAALVGPNCSRYLAIDAALGLEGAVTVPLYPTTPPAELDRLIVGSGARLAFVCGDAAETMRVDAGVRIVSFGRDPPPNPGVMTWDAFLKAGEGTAAPSSLVRPDDPATLRHTSGTTGEPHTVMFDHRNLRWMAECMASLLPWRSRIEPARYLSWLPMSHVVEGILATYAPYYLPAPVDIYFLEDFHQLPRALGIARPTVFFSVPRFYEKMWEVFISRPLARWFLAHRKSAGASILRPLLRRGLLRAAGLDRCAFLIVGSAPSDIDLLASFRSLGIEIHNAYGLTEAPLVTLNRLGTNRIGTVGQPLPETEVAIVEDEVTVRGPQVTRNAAQTSAGGWLRTGDLGHFTDDGDLVLDGRRKDIIATAYGKKIAVGAIEAALRSVPGVEEAMVVGECRPCCVALLWTGRHPPENVFAAIDRGVGEVNARYSPPERIRRWAVVEGSLSPQNGELTANLKLRRGVVAQKYSSVIDGLYTDAGTPPGVRHVGGSHPREGCT